MDGGERLLFQWCADHRNLRSALEYLSRHGGQSPGPDGEIYADLLHSDHLLPWLRRLSEELRNGGYQPGGEKKVPIPKPNGKFRTLILMDVLDRVVHRAVSQVMSLFLDPEFVDTSFAYRPRRGVIAAAAIGVRFAQERDRRVWVICDIKDAFNSIPHKSLLSLLKCRFPDPGLNRLSRTMLRSRETKGLRQGSPLSPFLLNFYLDRHLDKPWAAEGLPTILRYSDDLAVP